MSADYICSSGNRVEVRYGAAGLQVAWDRWPPSHADVAEWRAVRRDLIERALPDGTTFAVVDADDVPGCESCDE